jgi:PmbA protein
VTPGDVALDDMMADVKHGVLLSRFSGGQPSAKGDFLRDAKSSFYIENGKVRGPVSETMVSGNMAEVLMKIVAISREIVDFGSGVYPWVLVSGVVVS